MAKQVIGIGTVANDGTGDPARTAFGKVNDNFTENYDAIERLQAKGTDIASAETTDIGEATGDFVHITGTTTITGLGTISAGRKRTVRFAAILTLTHNATSLILPTGANITTAANDVATFVSEGSGNWRCVEYTRASGASLAGTSASFGGLTGAPTDNTALVTKFADYVDKETFTTLTFGATVNWNQSNKQTPLGKVTTTGNFTLALTNVKSGCNGILKITSNTASAFTVTFDTLFTNKSINSYFTTFVFPALISQEYFLHFVVDGTTIEWDIRDSAAINLIVQEEGSTLTSRPTAINFVGAGVAATNVGGVITVTITGGGSGFTAASVATINTGTNNTEGATALNLETSKYLTQSGSKTYAATGGTSTAYTVTLSPAITAYSAGQEFNLAVHTANTTTTPTINFSGLGAKNILNKFGTAIAVNDFRGDLTVRYNGTSFLIISGVGTNEVGNDKLGLMATNTVKSNLTGSSAAPSDNPVVSIYDSTYKAYKYSLDGMDEIISGFMFRLTSSVTVTGTSTTSIFGSGTATPRSISAGKLTAGKIIRVSFKSLVTTTNTTDTLTFLVKVAGTTIITVTSAVTNPILASKVVEGSFDLVIKTIGASGTANIIGVTRGGISVDLVSSVDFTLNTTIANEIDVQVTQTNASNITRTVTGTIELI